MRIEIDENGIFVISAENQTETYVIKRALDSGIVKILPYDYGWQTGIKNIVWNKKLVD